MPKTILIVEDELPLLRALTQKFEKEGFVILQAKDGVEGLAMAKSHHPDLILLDLLLPGLSGMEILRDLRRDEWGVSVPVIILTNLSDSEKVAEALTHDVGDYLVKSDWMLADLVKKVHDKFGLTN
ncbi:MAG: response regulator [Candidatus Magasanikbacteria bacterium]|nr:response regulator [Candidatus Magasanikbacteria bacterium]